MTLFHSGALLILLASFLACGNSGVNTATPTAPTTTSPAHLSARPVTPTQQCSPGLQSLGVAPERDTLFFVPSAARTNASMPLVLLLHGAGGSAEGIIGLMRQTAERDGFMLVVPSSRRDTWDVIVGGYGPDVDVINRSLAAAFERCGVDATHIAISGFSDGASYALSLGLSNGDLFTHVMAYSPGFMDPAENVGKPKIYISHGTHDRVLPIDRTSRRIVPQLQGMGYEVRYHEFDGEHAVPDFIVQESTEWFLGGTS